MLYTAKGTAALLVPLANVLKSATGSWHAVFYVAAILNIFAALIALVVLKPIRRQIADNFRPPEHNVAQKCPVSMPIREPGAAAVVVLRSAGEPGKRSPEAKESSKTFG
jgi:hypothetical protein